MSDATSVTEFLNTYYRTFSTLNVESIAPFFHEPCLFMGPQGVIAAPNHDVVKEVFKTIAKDLLSKGYGRSELTQLNVEHECDCDAGHRCCRAFHCGWAGA